MQLLLLPGSRSPVSLISNGSSFNAAGVMDCFFIYWVACAGTKYYFIFQEAGILKLWPFRLAFYNTKINFIGYKRVLDILGIS